MLPRSLVVSAPFVLALLLPLGAAANGPQEPADFSPTFEQQLLGFEDAGVDTGWIPANSPVQLRLFVDAANTVTIDLPGTAYYDWRTEELRFEGEPTAGYFEYDVGLEIVASVKVDVALAQWESDLLGPYDWGVQAADMFTPYLLEGNPERPVTLTDKSGALDLVSIPLVPDILILSGNLDIGQLGRLGQLGQLGMARPRRDAARTVRAARPAPPPGRAVARYCGMIPQPLTSDGMQPMQLQRK